MEHIGELLKSTGLFTPLSMTQKICAKHRIEYQEQVFKRFTRGCPECAKEAERVAKQREKKEQELANKKAEEARIAERIGQSRIPKRFQNKTISNYIAVTDGQKFVLERIKTYAREFTPETNSRRNLALLGNAGTGKTHLACAIGRHIIKNCNSLARFTSVSEINRLVREAKSYQAEYTETEVIEAFGGYDLLIIDEVGVQSGTDAESRALFDVFNERYQEEKPTILISNLNPVGFRDAVGKRIADRVKEDGGEILLFNWSSYRE